MPSLINSDDGVVSGSAGLKTTGSNDGILALQNNGTTNVTVTAAGNVGIGTGSPGGKLDVRAGTGATLLVAADATNLLSINNYDPTSGFRDFKYAGSTHQFFTGTAGGGSASEQARITAAGLFQFNSGYGSVATAYGCRAWVNFNGTGTVAIRASGNVSSITDNGVGNYTVNFTTSLPDADYGIAAFVGSTTTGVSRCIDNGGVTPTTSSLRITTRNSATGATTDDSIICVSIFR